MQLLLRATRVSLCWRRVCCDWSIRAAHRSRIARRWRLSIATSPCRRRSRSRRRAARWVSQPSICNSAISSVSRSRQRRWKSSLLAPLHHRFNGTIHNNKVRKTCWVKKLFRRKIFFFSSFFHSNPFRYNQIIGQCWCSSIELHWECQLYRKRRTFTVKHKTFFYGNFFFLNWFRYSLLRTVVNGLWCRETVGQLSTTVRTRRGTATIGGSRRTSTTSICTFSATVTTIAARSATTRSLAASQRSCLATLMASGGRVGMISVKTNVCVVFFLRRMFVLCFLC